MRIELKKISKDYINVLIGDIEKNIELYKEGNIRNIVDNIDLEENCVLLSEKSIYANFEYFDPFSNKMKWKQDFEIGKSLHRTFLSSDIPKHMFYEKEFWAYILHKVYAKYISERYIKRYDDEEEQHTQVKDRINRYFFYNVNHSRRSRTGLPFLWSIIDLTYENNSYELSEIAFRYIDSVKAIYERLSFFPNSNIIRAFIRGIKNNNFNPLFKHKTYRSLIPTHISNFAAVNMLDAYDYEQLVEVITEEQRKIIKIAG